MLIIAGFGSHGTVVLKGSWGGRPVAVKRLLSDFTRLASQEVKLLQASDDHPNVIRCRRLYDHQAVLTKCRLLPGTTGQFPVHRLGSVPSITGRSHRVARQAYRARISVGPEEGNGAGQCGVEASSRDEDHSSGYQASVGIELCFLSQN